MGQPPAERQPLRAAAEWPAAGEFPAQRQSEWIRRGQGSWLLTGFRNEDGQEPSVILGRGFVCADGSGKGYLEPERAMANLGGVETRGGIAAFSGALTFDHQCVLIQHDLHVLLT